MKALSTGGLLFTVAIVASLAVVGTGYGQTITPINTAVNGTASNPTLTYGSTTYNCNTGTATGNTGASATTSIDLALTFSGNCNYSGVGFTVTCTGTARLTVSGGATSGTINLNNGFTCTMAIAGVCNLDFEGPQTTGNTGTMNEGTDMLTATITVNGTRTGTSLCGPISGPASFTASYKVTPSTVTIT